MSFIVALSHDVDRIYKTYQYLTRDTKNLKLSNWVSLFKNEKPYWMFQKVMEVEDKYDVRSTFFFLHETMPFVYWPPNKWVLSLGRYSFNDVEDVIKQLDKNGWEIGLHGSYYSYKNEELLKSEKVYLENILNKKVIGIRQHYLNLEIPQTWKLQKKVGFLYDASYGKKGDIGFVDDKSIPFIDSESDMAVIPLTFMESYLFKKNNNDIQKVWSTVLNFIDAAEKNESMISILWHQRYFNNKEFPFFLDVYENLIKECKQRGAEFLTHKQIYYKTFKHNG